MRKIIFSLIFIVFLTSVIAADIIITQQPNDVYNLGDTINLPVKITTSKDLTSLFTIKLICNGVEEQVYQSDIKLSAGEEKALNPIIILTRDRIERSGTCVLKAILGTETSKVTNDFAISDYVSIALTKQKTEAAPQEQIILEGNAVKDNGQAAQGIGELSVIRDNETIISIIDTVKNGYFYFNFSLPKESKAGQYLVKLEIYETDLEGQKTNKGFINYNLLITQVPTSLEIVFDTIKVEPGTNLKVKAVLHDQTGVPIEAISIITIKNNENEIIEQTEKSTDVFLEFPINYNEPAATWKVIALSNKITSESSFNIIEKEDIEIKLINKTVSIFNKGNVPYCNKSVLIKIGNESVNIDVCLKVDEEQEYILTAPDGEYQIEIISDDEERISGSVFLTGKTIAAKEARKKFSRPLIWLLIIVVLGFVAFLFFKKVYKKNFFGYITERKERKKAIPASKSSLLNTKNKAELSLSIKGEKQNASIVCLKIKNLNSKESSSENVLQEIVEIAEEKKAYIYENNNDLFFIFAPVNTKTFNNEKTAVEVAQKIQLMLTENNRRMKEKIDFGIGVNYGTIIAKKEKDVMKFMSMGTLITTAKKTANASKGEILLGEKMHDKLRTSVKTEKEKHGNTELYRIKEIKDKENHRNFLSNFVKRLEKEKEEKESKEKE